MLFFHSSHVFSILKQFVYTLHPVVTFDNVYLETGQTVPQQVLLLPQVRVGSLPALDEVSAGCPHQELQVTPQLLRQVPQI